MQAQCLGQGRAFARLSVFFPLDIGDQIEERTARQTSPQKKDNDDTFLQFATVVTLPFSSFLFSFVSPV